MTDSTNSVRQRVEDIWKTHSDGQGVNAIISLITEAETKGFYDGRLLEVALIPQSDEFYKKYHTTEKAKIEKERLAALKETHEE